MERTSQQKGKFAEFLVFSKLIEEGADLYLPVIDTGIDAVVRQKDGTYKEIQVKSTEKEWSLAAWVPDNLQLLRRRFIVWVDMSKSKENPEIWVFPGEIFKDYSTKIGAEQNFTHRRLDLGGTRRGDDQPRCVLLNKYCDAWRLLTGDIRGESKRGEASLT
ncbi:MAG: hypothetical protein IMY77_02705 [Chloroflexi bacterium]|nr:hypothetical protein [Chloroflexota bacterium]